MHLKSIKLSGFKSFVEPTQMSFLSTLTGIVGPNGCGKSNIVDAIHCVFGSGSKYLRAEMMTDVIFNGTTSRKPVGKASIELIFNNSSARIKGEYAQYPEISIRRELTRDGQSSYFLNGTRCRRKDLTDLFLGTGIGQSSYAIIEQGMISRLIEAKPEDLRAHVEEAAGTSKYKERRRETENRIKHTRENLDRLNDLREEQGKQLNHLQRQASAAERFKTLRQEQRKFKADLQAIIWEDLSKEVSQLDTKIKEQENNLEAQQAEITRIDTDLEAKRIIRVELNDKVNNIQSTYYGLGAEIKNIEQQIDHAKERKRQLENDYQQLENSFQELTQQQVEDQNQLQQLKDSLSVIEQEHNLSSEQTLSLKELLDSSEFAMQQWQHEWDDFHKTTADTAKQLEVEKTKIHHLEQKQQTLLQRIARIRDERSQENSDEITKEILLLKEQQVACQERIEELQAILEGLQEKISQQRDAYQEAQGQVGVCTKELRDLQARYASLEALQRIALGKSDTEISDWLLQQGFSDYPRLAEGLKVESGWEVAFEVVLAHHLDAICVQDFKDINKAILELKSGNVTFFNLQPGATLPSGKPHSELLPLRSKITSDWPIGSLLDHVYCVEDLDSALQVYQTLNNAESIITRDGVWLSQSWLKISKQVNQKAGVLQREHDIKDIQKLIIEKQSELCEIERLAHKAQELVQFYDEERETVQQQFQTNKAKNSDFLAQIRAKEAYVTQLQAKQFSLSEEMQENDLLLADAEKSLEEAKANVQSYSLQVNEESTLRQRLLTTKDELRQKLDNAKQQLSVSKQKTDDLQVKLASSNNQLHFINQNLTRTERQLESIKERRLTLTETLNQVNDPIPNLTVILQETLEKRLTVEDELKKEKIEFDQIETVMVELEKRRHLVEKDMNTLRTLLEQKRLDCHTLKMKQQSCIEQIHEAGFELDAVISELPENKAQLAWEEHITKLDNRIQRLGPINLAAIEEYAQLQEKTAYLTSQYDDLVEALTTLENAIKKIDRETRQRFKETYEQLNESFKVYFKQIFGGGEAYLELTSDDLLETGVLVRAQPPGKKNTTIHLLSGGEKALTAIALVFAIFNLNPAPFCILDEVDAPLDDANVVRFCNLVKKMAEKVQFIFISHNKIAIEMAEQLIGVTMHEPGVSRLVSVDIDQAITMATA